MKKSKHILCISTVLFVTISAFTQTSKFSGWGTIVNTTKLGSKTQLIFDAQIRSTDNWIQTETVIIRPGIAHSFNAHNSISAGLALINNRKNISGVTDFVSDNRLWQQWLLLQKLRKNTLQHRIRLEERMIPSIFISGTELKKKDSRFNARLRYFNRYLSGFQRGMKFSYGPYWVIQNEFFFNVIGARYANKKIFDQTRTYAGTGWRFSQKTDLEFGYMLQHVEGMGDRSTNNHILQLTSFFRL